VLALTVAGCTYAGQPPSPAVTPPGAAATPASASVEPQPPFRSEPLLTAWGAPPEGQQHAERQRTYDLQHQVVHVRFDWARHAVVGSTSLTLAPLDTALRDVALDAVDMTFGSVTDSLRQKLMHDYDGRTLTVHLAEPLPPGEHTVIQLDYETVRPKQGAYFIDRNHYLWTQGETEANRYWIPTYDYPNDRLTWEFFITTSPNEKALSNGRLMGTRQVPDGLEWHWALQHPSSSYLMSAATGDYAVVEDHYQDVPVEYWTYPDSVAAAKRGFGMTPRAIDVYARKTGVPYAWSKYAQVVAPDFIFGGMENVTATTQQDDGILFPAWAEPQANSSGLVAHELAHQWFGDLLTTRNWPNIWLNEGFATFMEQIFQEADQGQDEGDYDRLGAQEQVLAADRRARRPLVYDRWVTDPFELFFSGHIYPKGATVMQQLRHQLGDSLFWASMHRYTVDHMYQTVVSSDLEKAFEQTTGKDFAPYFKQWVYGAGYPVFQVTYSWDAPARSLLLAATEVQPRDSLTGWFDVDVDVQVLTDAGSVKGKMSVRNGQGQVTLQLPAAPRAIDWDDGGWLLDLADFPRPVSMLAYQLAHDDDVIGRIDAAAELARHSSDNAAVVALATALQSDRFWGVRQRVAGGLRAFAGNETAKSALLAASSDQDARVRQTAAGVLASYPGDAVAARLTELARSDASLFVRGTALRSLAAVAPAQAIPIATAMLGQDSWSDVLRVSGIRALAAAHAPAAWSTFLGYLPPAHGRNVRQAAIQALASLARGGREAELATSLEPLLGDQDLFIRQQAAGALGALGQPSSLAALRARRSVEAESRVLNSIDEAIGQLEGK